MPVSPRIASTDVAVRPHPRTIGRFVYPPPPEPTVADEGCFTQDHPGWRVAIYEDAPDRHRLFVGDADDQCHEVVGAPTAVRDLYELLTGSGPLSRTDIVGVLVASGLQRV